MITKYGELPDAVLREYVVKVLVGKIFKLLPLREENNPTLVEYHTSLMFELHGEKSLIIHLHNDPTFLSMLGSLESLVIIEDQKAYRRKVFECISICKKLYRGE